MFCVFVNCHKTVVSPKTSENCAKIVLRSVVNLGPGEHFRTRPKGVKSMTQQLKKLKKQIFFDDKMWIGMPLLKMRLIPVTFDL